MIIFDSHSNLIDDLLPAISQGLIALRCGNVDPSLLAISRSGKWQWAKFKALPDHPRPGNAGRGFSHPAPDPERSDIDFEDCFRLSAGRIAAAGSIGAISDFEALRLALDLIEALDLDPAQCEIELMRLDPKRRATAIVGAWRADDGALIRPENATAGWGPGAEAPEAPLEEIQILIGGARGWEEYPAPGAPRNRGKIEGALIEHFVLVSNDGQSTLCRFPNWKSAAAAIERSRDNQQQARYWLPRDGNEMDHRIADYARAAGACGYTHWEEIE